MGTAGNLKVSLTAETSQFSSGMKQSADSVQKFSEKVKESSGHHEKFSASMLASRHSVHAFSEITGQSASPIMGMIHAFEALPGPLGVALGVMVAFKMALDAQNEAMDRAEESSNRFVDVMREIGKTTGATELAGKYATGTEHALETAKKGIDDILKDIKEHGNEFGFDKAGTNAQLKMLENTRNTIMGMNHEMQEFSAYMQSFSDEKLDLKLNADPEHRIKGIRDELKLATETAGALREELDNNLLPPEMFEKVKGEFYGVMMEIKGLNQELRNQGKEIENSVLTPMQKYTKEVAHLKELWDDGDISKQTYDKAVLAAKKKENEENMKLGGGNATFASAVKMSDLAVQKMDHQKADTSLAQLDEARQQTDLLQQLIDVTKMGAPAIAQ